MGGGEGGWCQFHTCIHMYAHAHMYASTNTYAHTYPYMLIMINMAASMVAAICNFLTCSFLVLHVCTCVHMCTHACVHVGKPFYVPRYSLTHLPRPPGAEEAQIVKTL